LNGPNFLKLQNCTGFLYRTVGFVLLHGSFKTRTQLLIMQVDYVSVEKLKLFIMKS